MNKYKKELVSFYSTAFIAILSVGALIQDVKYFIFLGLLVAACSILYLVNKLIYLILNQLFPEENTFSTGSINTHIINFNCNGQKNTEKNS